MAAAAVDAGLFRDLLIDSHGRASAFISVNHRAKTRRIIRAHYRGPHPV